MKSLYLRAFVAGSSFPAVIIPLLYLGIAITLNPEAGFHYFYEVVSVMILFGLLNILFISIKEIIPFSGSNKYWAFWAFHGMFFSFLWNFWLHIPEKLFLLTGWVQYLTIPVAMILYACIWRHAVREVNIMMGIEE